MTVALLPKGSSCMVNAMKIDLWSVENQGIFKWVATLFLGKSIYMYH